MGVSSGVVGFNVAMFVRPARPKRAKNAVFRRAGRVFSRKCRWRGRAARCARGRRPARDPSAPRASLGASPRSPARPRHRPRAPQPGPPTPSAPVGSSWLCCSARRLEARPDPAAAHGHRGRSLRRPPRQWGWVADGRVFSTRGQAPPPLSNFARNSPVTLSNNEFRSLELQRFQSLLKLRPIELRAKLRGLVSAMVCELVHCLPFRCNALPG